MPPKALFSQTAIDAVIDHLGYSRHSRNMSYLNALLSHAKAAEALGGASVSPDTLVTAIWDTTDPGLLRSRRKNLNTMRTSINRDLATLFSEGKNPEGVTLSPDHALAVSQEAKDALYAPLVDHFKPSDISLLDQAGALLEALAEMAGKGGEAGQESGSMAEKLKNALSALETSQEDVDEELDEEEALEEIDEDEAFEEIDDDEAFEEIDEDEAFEEIDEDEAFEEIDEDEALEEIDEDEALEEIDEDEALEEIDEDEALEEIDDDEAFEEIDEDEALEEIDDDETFEEIDEDEALEEIDDDETFEEIDDDEAFEEIDEDEALEEIDDDEAFEEIDEDDIEGLRERFEALLNESERYYNHYIPIPAGRYPAIDPITGAEIHVALEAFLAGKYPITNALFEAFISHTGYRTTAEERGFGTVYEPRLNKHRPGQGISLSTSRGLRLLRGATWSHPSGLHSSVHTSAHHPVVQVSFEDAMAFAAWTGKQLPTLAQWLAAGGHTATPYPWGDAWGTHLCNTEEVGAGGTLPVDTFPSGASPFGVYDLMGNAMEWICDRLPEKGGEPVKLAVGGSFLSDRSLTRQFTCCFDTRFSSNTLGFRCIGG